MGQVLVADASRRTTAENAYVTGLLGSKRMVLYDTLIEKGDEDETAFVVAHELGHQSKRHVLKGLGLSIVGLFLTFFALRWLATLSIWGWAGADGIGDPRSLPLLLLIALIAGILVMPVENAISRRHEAEADRVAIALTGDPDTAVRVFRRLAFSNISDLRPQPLAVLALFSHPPTTERIEEALAEASGNP